MNSLCSWIHKIMTISRKRGGLKAPAVLSCSGDKRACVHRTTVLRKLQGNMEWLEPLASLIGPLSRPLWLRLVGNRSKNKNKAISCRAPSDPIFLSNPIFEQHSRQAGDRVREDVAGVLGVLSLSVSRSGLSTGPKTRKLPWERNGN